MTTAQERAELRKLAEAATQGEWKLVDAMVYELRHYGWKKGEEVFENRWSANLQGPFDSKHELLNNAEFIAATNPATTLELLYDLDRLTEERDLAISTIESRDRNIESMADAYQELQAKLTALEGQEPVAIAECKEVHGSFCQFLNRTRHGMDTIKDGDKLYAAAGAAPKGLFIDMIAQHKGLAEEMREMDQAPVPMTKQQIDDVVYQCRRNGKDTTYDIVNAAIVIAAAPRSAS